LISRHFRYDGNEKTLRMSFDEKVWNLMKLIPRGRVTTYGLIAKKLNTKAYRAVGNACRRNPYAPRIPCHRVVRSDGTVGGFGGKTSGPTVNRKITLLRKERVEIRNGKVANFERFLFEF
jgi:O-6-methylguanine DNA methyltransferase